MALTNISDLTHIIRTTKQWNTTSDKYDIIPEGVLCIELVDANKTNAKVGDGHKTFAELPYLGSGELSNYYTKIEADNRVLELIEDSTIVRIKGIADSYSKLPVKANIGDMWFVKHVSQSETNPQNHYIEYIYSKDNKWEIVGNAPIDIDLSAYAKYIDEISAKLKKYETDGTFHTHANKDILDKIDVIFTQEEKEKLASLYNYDDTELRKLATHSNRDILDAIESAFTNQDRIKFNRLKNYDDTLLKLKISALEKLSHEHSNKEILDNTTAPFLTEYEKKMKYLRPYVGATAEYNGAMGLVPPAESGQEDYVLSGSGEWVPNQGGSAPIDPATKTKAGIVKIGDGINVKPDGRIDLLPPNIEDNIIGGITPGTALSTNEHGKLDVLYGTGLGIDEEGKLYATGETEEPYLYYAGNAITFEVKDPEKDHLITINADIATYESSGVVIIGDGLSVDEDGLVSVKIGEGLTLNEETGNIDVIPIDVATYETSGVVIIGDGLSVDEDGLVSVKLGKGLSFNEETGDIDADAEVEIATEEKPGIVKPGKGLNISEDGTLDVTMNAPDNYHPGKGIYFTTVNETYHGVKYLETDGIDKVIDTKVLPAPNMEIHVLFSLLDPLKEAYVSGVDNTSNAGFSVGTSDGSILLTNDFITSPDKSIASEKMLELLINIPEGKALSNTIPLFARSYNGTYDGFAKMRIYSTFIVANNEVVKAGLVPVVRDSDNKPGLFNMATGEFLTNELSSDDFIAGELTDVLYPMTHGDDKYINISPATEYSIGGVIVKEGLSIDDKGFLKVAIGDSLYIDDEGLIQVVGGGGTEYIQGGGISIDKDITKENTKIITNTGILDVTESEENNQFIITTKDGTKPINITPSIDEIPIATKTTLGGIIVGDNLTIDDNGKLSATSPGVDITFEEGSGIGIDESGTDTKTVTISNTGILDVKESEEKNQFIITTIDGDKAIEITPSVDELPIATEDTLGGIKVGDGLEIDPATGVLSATGGGGSSKDLTVSAGEGINVQTKSFDPTAEYHRISYIRNNQDSYIIIPDYIANSSTRVVVEYAHNPGVYRTDGALFGAKSSSYGYSWYSYWRSGYDYFTGGFQYGSNSTSTVNVSGYPQGTKMLLDVSTHGVYLNKELIQSVVEKGSLPAYPMSIFAASSTSTGTTTIYKPGAYTIYSFKIYEGEDLVKDLVPALNSEMVPGLWDLVNGVFYGSANTNSFAYDSTSVDMDKGTYIVSSSPATLTTIGGIKPGNGLKVTDDGTLNVSETIISEVDIDFKTDEGLLIHDVPDHGDIVLPTGYKSISYIESRANAYMNLDYNPSSNTRLSIDVSFKQGSGNFSTNAGAIIGEGSQSSDSVPKYTLWGAWSNSMTSPLIRLSNGTVNRDSVPGAELLNYYDHKRITFDIIPMDGLYADGEKIQDWEGGEFEPGTRQIQINRSSSYTTYGIRIYSIKIWDKDVLLLNLVPVLDPSNVSGLYDTIRRKFFKTLSSANYLYDETSVDVITVEKTLTLLPATKTFIGGVRIGDGLSVDDDGTINVTGGGGGGSANIEVGNGLTMSGSSSITYEILDFVQTNGHQSVLTDLYPSTTKTSVEVKYEFLNTSNDNVVFSTGRAFGSGEMMYGILNTTGWHLCSAIGMGSRYDFLETSVPTGVVEDTYMVIDRSSYGSTLTGTKSHSMTVATSSPIQLFKVNNWSTLATIKLYSMNIFNDDTLVGELVPARNRATKMVGILNKTTNMFYTSDTENMLIAGEPTGETVVVGTDQKQIIKAKLGNGLKFDEKGAIALEETNNDGDNDDVVVGKVDLATDPGLRIYNKSASGSVALPKGYSSISYIEPMSAAYIELDYYPKNTTRTIVRTSFTLGLSDDAAIFGSRNISGTYYVFWIHYESGSPSFRFENGTQGWSSISPVIIPDYTPHKIIEIDANPSNGEVCIDGVKLQNCTGGTFASDAKLHLFAINGYNHGAEPSRMYSTKIYENNELKLDLVPALNEENEAGMYDGVNDKFYKAKQGSFIYDESTVTPAGESTRTIALLPATTDNIGGIKVGDGLSINERGKLNVTGENFKSIACLTLMQGSQTCAAKTTSTVSFNENTLGSGYTTIKIFWSVSDTVGVSEIDATNMGVLQNVVTASDSSTTNIIQFKVASDGRSMTVNPGTTAVMINEVIAYKI